MPKLTPDINLGQIVQILSILIGAGIIYGAQQAETRELRAWLIRHDAQLQRHTDSIAAHDIADAKSIEDRANFRAALIEIKADQKEILRAIKAFPSQ